MARGELEALAILFYLKARNIIKGTNQRKRNGRETGQPFQPTAAQNVEANSFGSVIARMRKGNPFRARFRSDTAQKRMARVTSGLLRGKVSPFLQGRNINELNTARHVQTVAKRANVIGIGFRFRAPKAMIEMTRDE